MTRVFETKDKTGRNIYLTDERLTHINLEHPEVAPYLKEFEATLKLPTKVTQYPYDKHTQYFYRYFKSEGHYLLIIVKYLNGEGFIITAYFVGKIK